MNRKKRSPIGRLCAAGMLFYLLAFGLLAVRDASMTGYVLAAAVPCLLFVGSFLLPRLISADRLLMTLTNFLCAMGVLLRYTTDPSEAIRQAVCYGIGMFFLLCAAALMQRFRPRAAFLAGVAALSLLLTGLPLLLGNNPDSYPGWREIGGFSLQPAELGKPFLVLALAGLLSRRRLLPALGFSAAVLALLLLQGDPGSALICWGAAVLLLWSATGNWILLILGLAVEAIVAGAGELLFPALRLPFSLGQALPAGAEGTSPESLALLASGGLWGEGLGLSALRTVPSGQPDFAFAALCQSFGFIVGVCVLLLFAAVLWRGTSIARSARRGFAALSAMGSVILIGLQVLFAVSGEMNLIPWSGAALPFVSSNEASLIACLGMMGLIHGVFGMNESALAEDGSLAMLERSGR